MCQKILLLSVLEKNFSFRYKYINGEPNSSSCDTVFGEVSGAVIDGRRKRGHVGDGSEDRKKVENF